MYAAERLDEQLQRAARSFISDPANVNVNVAEGKLELSKIFQWYKQDFGGSLAAAALWCLPLLPAAMKSSLCALWQLPAPPALQPQQVVTAVDAVRAAEKARLVVAGKSASGLCSCSRGGGGDDASIPSIEEAEAHCVLTCAVPKEIPHSSIAITTLKYDWSQNGD